MERIQHDLEQRVRLSLGRDDVAVGVITAFGDGHGGFTYSTTIASEAHVRRCVLRLSPPGVRIAGPADVGRQGRIMRALANAAIPVPQPIAFDSTPVVAGRAFLLVPLLDGTTWREASAAKSHSLVAQRTVEVLLRIHALPLRATGLWQEAPLTPTQELARWKALMGRARDLIPKQATTLHDHLRSAIPRPSLPTLVHGDFHYGNILFRDGEIVGVLDWEMASIGERLLDVASLVIASLRERYKPEPNSAGSVRVRGDELLDMYAGDSRAVEWFIALTCLKYAAIIGYNLRLHRLGRRVDPVYEELRGTIVGLIEDGSAILRDGLEAGCLAHEV